MPGLGAPDARARRCSRRSAFGKSSCCDLLERRARARPAMWSALPVRREPPEQVRSADEVPGVGEALRQRRGCTAPTPKISWITRTAACGRFVRCPYVQVHRAVGTARRLIGSQRRHERMVSYVRRATVAWSARCVSTDFDYELPGRAHRPGARSNLATPRGCWSIGERGARAPPRARSAIAADRDGDLLVVNDTKVIPARLPLHRDDRRRCRGAAARADSDAEQRRTWEAMIRPAASCASASGCRRRRWRPLVEIGDRTDGRRHVGGRRCSATSDPLDAAAAATARCRCRRYIGARARPSPTATRRCTPPSPARPRHPPPGCTSHRTLLDAASPACGVEIATVELVVGLDTFKPVVVDDPAAARDAQRAVSRAIPAVLEQCRQARRGRRRRHHQRARARIGRAFGELRGRTRLFIHRPYDWQVVDVLMTNFHLPRTTLLMMIDAFVGDRWRRLYDDCARRAATASSASATRCCSTGGRR